MIQKNADAANAVDIDRRTVARVVGRGLATCAVVLITVMVSNPLRAEPIEDLELPMMRPGHVVVVPKRPDHWSDEEIAQGRAKCVAILIEANAEFKILGPIRKGACGTPAPVKLSALGANVRVKITPPASLNCNMVSALNQWLEEKVQPLAKNQFGSQVVEIRNISAYACRRRYNNPRKKLSEHALANALDIAGLRLSDGRYLSLLEHWGETKRQRQQMIARAKTEWTKAQERAQARIRAEAKANAKADTAMKDPTAFVTSVTTDNGDKIIKSSNASAKTVSKTVSNALPKALPMAEAFEVPKAQTLDKRAHFLRQLHTDACGIFGTVLGPEANQAHANHYHFDLAPRRRSAYCE